MSDRLRRLLLLVPAARAKPGVTLTDLAASLDSTPEDLRRDIDLLSNVGVPPYQPDDLIEIELRGERVFVSLPQGFDRPTRLTWTEAAALAMAVQSLAPSDPSARSAMSKLERAVPADKREFYASLTRFAPSESESTADVEATLVRASNERHVVEMSYYSRSDLQTRTRTIRPRAVVTANGAKYLSARNEGDGDRWYRLDRIGRATLTEKRFDALPAIDLATEAKRLNGLDDSGLPSARIRFDARVALAATARHPLAEKHKDGSVEADVPYSTLPWLISYALSWGGAALILSPPDARTAMRAAVEAALAAA